MVSFGIVNSTIITEFSLSKGGGGSSKTFRSPTIQFRIFVLKVSCIGIVNSPF